MDAVHRFVLDVGVDDIVAKTHFLAFFACTAGLHSFEMDQDQRNCLSW